MQSVSEHRLVNRIAPYIEAPPPAAPPAPPPTFAERLDALLKEDPESKLSELGSYLDAVLKGHVSFAAVPEQHRGNIGGDRRRDFTRLKKTTKLRFEASRNQGNYVATRLRDMHRSDLLGGVLPEPGDVYRVSYWRTVYRHDPTTGRVAKYRVQHQHWLEDTELFEEAPQGMVMPLVAKQVYRELPRWLLPERRVIVGRMKRNLIVAREVGLYRKPKPRAKPQELGEEGLDLSDPAILLGPYVLHGWV